MFETAHDVDELWYNYELLLLQFLRFRLNGCSLTEDAGDAPEAFEMCNGSRRS